MYILPQISSHKRLQMIAALFFLFALCISSTFLTPLGRIYSLIKVSLSSKVLYARFCRSFINQAFNGTPNPFFSRLSICLGNSLFKDFFKIYFFVNPLSFSDEGIEAANSISLWSKKGDLASRLLAIVAISILTNKSYGRYFFISEYIILLRKS